MSEEEIIKMLEHSIDTYIEDTKVTKVELTTEQAQVLLDLYNKQKEEKTKLLDLYNDKVQEILELEQNSNSKDKIREMIKEIKPDIFDNEEDIKKFDYCIYILNELLEGGKDV